MGLGIISPDSLKWGPVWADLGKESRFWHPDSLRRWPEEFTLASLGLGLLGLGEQCCLQIKSRI